MELIIGLGIGAFIQWKFDVITKASDIVARVKGLFK